MMHITKDTKSFKGKEVIGSVPKFIVPKIVIIGDTTRINENESIKRVRQKEITPRGNRSTRKIMLR